jgi:hypothetical protein
MDPIKQLLNTPPAGTSPIYAFEVAALYATANEAEWNRAVTAIQAARGGHYPPDWFEVVMASGLHAEIAASWPKKSA